MSTRGGPESAQGTAAGTAGQGTAGQDPAGQDPAGQDPAAGSGGGGAEAGSAGGATASGDRAQRGSADQGHARPDHARPDHARPDHAGPDDGGIDQVAADRVVTARPPAGTAALRAEIEQTRAALGETVSALAAKADVKARARDKADELKAEAKAKIKGTARDAGGVAHDRYSDVAYRAGRSRERISAAMGRRWRVLVGAAGLAALVAGLTARIRRR